ncbi:dihydroxy-acid dehydratase [Escherichia coli]
MPAFEAGLLDRDCVVVVRHQGPKVNGMPELHKLMPPLGVLLDRCFKIALVTDGPRSRASGKVPSAIHVTPEAYDGGLLAKVRDWGIILCEWTDRRTDAAGKTKRNWLLANRTFLT